MGFDYGKSRSSKIGQIVQDSEFECQSRGLGEAPRNGRRARNDSFFVGRENSAQRNTVASTERGDNRVDGKIIDQLAIEIEEEIFYYKSRASRLEGRLNELRKLSGQLKEISSRE